MELKIKYNTPEEKRFKLIGRSMKSFMDENYWLNNWIKGKKHG